MKTLKSLKNQNRLSQEQAGNLAVLLALFLYAAWYLWDTWQASTQIYNLIFVLPLTVSILLLCLLTFLKELLVMDSASQDVSEAPEESTETKESTETMESTETVESTETIKSTETATFKVVLLFVGYVVTLPWLGFDVGTFIFIALFLYLAGEKKWQWALGYSLVFAFSSALFFSYMLPYPMPLLLLPGGS
ncbi:MAG: tripartite tricarboxylate transporter TctB family protein [Gammaproteobacteria bacterium]|nr:tripartite tricarboxylate transporter TctB family protein [Gammaproteobacteria bacterium]